MPKRQDSRFCGPRMPVHRIVSMLFQIRAGFLRQCISHLVLFQCHNYGFSAPVVFRSKALCAGKAQSIRFAHGAGPGRTLVKHCTKSRRPEATQLSAGHHRIALRVSLSTPTDASLKAPTFGAPLAKGAAITCEARFASVDKLTELAIIMLKEH